MDADVVALANGLVPILQGSLGGGITVAMEYEVTFDAEMMVGTQVIVFPSGYLSGEGATRREDYYDVTCIVVVAERYTGDSTPARAVDKAWVSSKIAMVEQLVFNPITDSRAMYDTLNPAGNVVDSNYWSHTAEVTVLYDYRKLTQNKVFWSEIEVTFRKLKV